MSYSKLKEEVQTLRTLLEDSAVTVLPPAEATEKSPEAAQEQAPAYPAMQKVHPKNGRVKAAYIDRASQNATQFVFVIEELERGDDDFHGRAAIVCKHGGKLVYAGVSFPQKAKQAIPSNLYKMIPVRGASMPAWVKPYIDTAIQPED